MSTRPNEKFSAPLPDRYASKDAAVKVNLENVLLKSAWRPEFSPPTADGPYIDESFLADCMQSWVAIQCDANHFVCRVCGRRSMAFSDQDSVCMCCINMQGMASSMLQPHPVMEQFAYFASQEIVSRLPHTKVTLIRDKAVSRRRDTGNNQFRPDIALSVYYKANTIFIMIETDSTPKNDEETRSRDNKLLGSDYKLDSNALNIKAVILRINMQLEQPYLRTYLFLSLWQVIFSLTETFYRQVINQQIPPDKKKGKVYLNYKRGYYNKVGIRLQSTEEWLSQELDGLMQQDALRIKDWGKKPVLIDHSERNISLLFLTDKELTARILQDIPTNAYIVVYLHSNLVLARVEDMDFVQAAQSNADVPIRYFNGLQENYGRTAAVNSDTVRVGKYLLVKHILVHRYLDSIRNGGARGGLKASLGLLRL